MEKTLPETHVLSENRVQREAGQGIGLQSSGPSNVMSLMKAGAYFQGPEVIEPWLSYIRDGWNGVDLDTDCDRLKANIDLLVAAQCLPDSPDVHRILSRNASLLFNSDSRCGSGISAAASFSNSCALIEERLRLPDAELPHLSYSPIGKPP